MHTTFDLMARHDGRVVIPVNAVVKDYFPHRSTDEANSQKSAKGVHIVDLAQSIDDRRMAAIKESRQLAG